MGRGMKAGKKPKTSITLKRKEKVSWTHLKGTDECSRNKKEGVKPSEETN